MPLLLVAFLLVPLAELAVIVQVQQVAGLGWTLLALVLISFAGAALVKREGLKAWRRFREALDQVRLPATEVVDGALVLLAGALLLTPGFLTDGVGFLLLLPPSRAVVNRLLRGRARRSFGLPGTPRRTGPAGDGPLEVDVLEVRRTEERPGRRDAGAVPPGEEPPRPHGEAR